MGIINIVKTIKEIHKNDVAIVKIGKFYQIYGKDAYIVSYLFNYKLKEIEGVAMCGFPINSIKRVISVLEQDKINYIILDRKNNYEVEERFDNKNLNNYLKYFKKAREYINYKKRIENINDFMIENMNNKEFGNIIKEMEALVNERRKVPSN